MIHLKFLPYWFLNLKRLVEQIFMFPFVLWGRIFWRSYFRNESIPIASYDLICFYPGAGVGGAERTNAYVLDCNRDKRKLVFFTKRSDSSVSKKLFENSNSTLIDIGNETDSKLKYWKNFIWRGAISQFIKKESDKARIFIGQCNFGYKITPHLSKNLKVVDLLHMTDDQYANVWVPFIQFIQVRVLLSEYIKKEFEEFYKEKGIPDKYLNRIVIIPNKASINNPNYIPRPISPLKITYVGRGGRQKRLWLMNRVIERTADMDVEFHLAGNMEDELPSPLPSNVFYHGKIPADKMEEFYADKNALLMTSAFEGFPFSIVEAMTMSMIPIVTAVNSIPEHLKNGENSLLMENFEDEDAVVNDAVNYIKMLMDSPELYENISRSAHKYIQGAFDETNFCRSYNSIFWGSN